MNAKLLIPVAVLVSLVGCANHNPPAQVHVVPATPRVADTGPVDGVYKLQGYKGPEAMDSQEVVQASKECIYNKMRPNVSYLYVRTDQGKTRVPVSVTCDPF
jgi:uncharacterized lipoprotein YmbA